MGVRVPPFAPIPYSSAVIRAATDRDASGIARIYNHYVVHSVVTFEEETVSDDEMARRVREVQSAALPWLVADEEGHIAGYAYAGKWKARSGYRFTVESSVYLDPAFVARGLGTALYETLLAILREKRIHTVIGGIALPNPSSIALHEKLGFEKVAHFREQGFKFNRWIDVGYWQLML